MSVAVPTALRLFLRLLLWVVIGCAAFVGVILVVMLIHPDRPSARPGAVIMLVPVAAVAAGAVWGLRRLPRFSAPLERASERELAVEERRVLAGETVVLRPSLRRTVVLGSVCLLATAAFVFALAEKPHWFLFAGAAVFGSVTVLWGMRLVPGRMDLRISPDGLVVGGAFKRKRWEWNQIGYFAPYEVYTGYGSSAKMVGFERRDIEHRRQGFWKAMNRGVSGVDVSLPDTYGLRHVDLAQLLQAAHDRYATEFGPNAADRELMEEVEHIRRDRVPLVSAGLAVACVGVFVLEAARYGLFPDDRELYLAGAASRDALAAGRWWTLPAANVLHANPIHLLLNLFALVLLGWLLEREIGWAKVAVLCVAGGLAATGAAVLIQPHTEVVGVSGVIFALLGWAVVRDRASTRALGRAAWCTLVPGLVYTFLVPHVSIGAHLGGLAAGVVLGWAVERGQGADREPAGAGALSGGVSSPRAASAAVRSTAARPGRRSA